MICADGVYRSLSQIALDVMRWALEHPDEYRALSEAHWAKKFARRRGPAA